MNRISANGFLIIVFLAMVAAPGLVQTAHDARRGAWPHALDVFTRRPTPANLRSFDQALEDASITVRTLRPWMQAAQFLALRDAGEKALVGRDGWFFYGPGVAFLTQRPKPSDSTPTDALSAVVQFRDQLAERGIRLLLMPAPNKESIYPEKLSRWASPPTRIPGSETRQFFALCTNAGLEVVDLFRLYRSDAVTPEKPAYLKQDSHWSPTGMELAAHAVADHILARGWLGPGAVGYGSRSVEVKRLGDVVRMTRSPTIEASIPPESITCNQIVRDGSADLYHDDPGSEVLVLGDSFFRIYERDEPGQAGFVAHLAQALRRPMASIVHDGGASTLVRQELFRRPQLLARTKVVVWEFVERDLRLGTEGWKHVPLPPSPPTHVPPPERERDSG